MTDMTPDLKLSWGSPSCSPWRILPLSAVTLCHCSVCVKWRSIFNHSTTESSVIRLEWQIRLPAAKACFLLSFSLKSGRFWEKTLILWSRAHLLASEVKRPIIRWEPGGRCPTSVWGPAAGSFEWRAE